MGRKVDSEALTLSTEAVGSIKLAVASMPGELSIRRGTTQDLERISAFITALSEEYIVGEFSAEGREHFLRDHSTSEVRQRLAGEFRFYLAETGDELAGVAAIRLKYHAGSIDSRHNRLP